MSETEKQNPEENVVAEDQIPDDLVNEEAAEEATVDTASAAEEAKSDAVRVAELDAQNAQLTDKLLRTMADMENLRNRTRRDKEDAIKYAPQKLVTDLIGVMEILKAAAGPNRVPEFQSSHPDPENRIAKIKEAIRKYRK